MAKSEVFCMDCMDAMRCMPDKAFDLAIVDPPYGEKINGKKINRSGGTWAARYGRQISKWDVPPNKDYFDELFRVSKEQIIWGGNYFSLPPNRCFIVWRKLTISERFTMAMAEYAWASFNRNAVVIEAAPQGTKRDPRVHPTQKPIRLYAEIYRLFCKEGDTILDTHMGSGSSRIAAYQAGLDFVGYEIDKTYFQSGCDRFERATSQMGLFWKGDRM